MQQKAETKPARSTLIKVTVKGTPAAEKLQEAVIEFIRRKENQQCQQ